MTTWIIRRPCIAAACRSNTRAVSPPTATGSVPCDDGPADPRETVCSQEGAAGVSPYARVFEEYAASEYVGLGHLFIG
jgi:hypothetical protein